MANREEKSKLTSAEFAALRHWSLFGRPGEPQTSRAKPQERRTKPFSKPQTATWNIALNTVILEKLILGFSPAQMEDKWFVFSTDPDSDGNMCVHMHRSWTGNKIIELSIKLPTQADQAPPVITAITWETDQEIYRGTGEEGAKQTAREVSEWVLGVELGSTV